jgi:uncharacterized protein YjbI with pentapeptide repeats
MVGRGVGKRGLLKGYAGGERDFLGVVLFRADLSGRELPGINLEGAYLYEVDFRGTVLEGAILSGADMTRANLRGANLTGADLSGVALRSVGRSGQLTFDEHTVFPDDDALLQGTTMDGIPFVEWRDTVRALGPHPSRATLAVWHHMRDVQLARELPASAPCDRCFS